jgi:hypothetical protein
VRNRHWRDSQKKKGDAHSPVTDPASPTKPSIQKHHVTPRTPGRISSGRQNVAAPQHNLKNVRRFLVFLKVFTRLTMRV